MKRRGSGEGTVTYWQAKKLWVAKFTLPDGKRKTKYGKTQKEVKDWLLEIRQSIGEGYTPEADKMTLAVFLEKYLKDYAKHAVKASTYQSYEQYIRLYLLPELGTVRLSQLRPDHLHTVYSKMRGRGLSERTCQYTHGILHRALNKALKWGLVTRNVADAADAPKPRRKVMKVWTRDQVRTFLEHIKGHRWAALFFLACSTGMREGELLGLPWSAVDLQEGKLQVNQTLMLVGGKLTLTQPKSDRSRRLIVLPAFVVEAFKEHKTHQDTLKAGNWTEHGLVFTTNVGTPISPRNLIRFFKQELAEAGLPDIRFHDLRHTAASLLLERNTHPKVVQELLGHSSVTLTLDTYSHLMPTMQSEAAKSMDDLVGR